jgi:hypothetical protein
VDIEINHEAFSFGNDKREALTAWMQARLKKDAGAGVKIAKKFGSRKLSFKTGLNGNLKLKNFGLGLALTYGTSVGVSLASGGSHTLGIAGSGVAMMFYSTVGPALQGSWGAWSQAREESLGPLAAFSRVCQRAWRGFACETLPNPWKVGVVVVGPLAIAMDKIEGVTGQKAPGSKFHELTQRATMRLLQGANWLIQKEEVFSDWRFGQEVEGARLEGARHVGVDIYAALAKGWLRQRLFLADIMPESVKDLDKLMEMTLSPAEKAQRERFGSVIEQGPKNNEELLKQMRLVEAAKIDPWFKPEPGMPSVHELANSFAQWRKGIEGDDEQVDHKLAGWSARVEAESLRAVVGQASRAGHGQDGPAPAKRARL